MTTFQKQNTEDCCPIFRPEKWDNKTFNWKNKPFIKDSVPALFHIPSKKMLNKKITRMVKEAEFSNKLEKNKEDVLLLFADPNPFKSNIYLSVTGKVPNLNNTELSGTFIAKVFDGQYKSIPKFLKQMNILLKKQNKKVKTHYIHYAYCPKCAKTYGNNYMVLFAKV